MKITKAIEDTTQICGTLQRSRYDINLDNEAFIYSFSKIEEKRS
jgi:hypothetical protein